MITVLLVGNASQTVLGQYLFEKLSRNFSVSYYCQNSYFQKGMGQNLILCDTAEIAFCQLHPCIVILKPEAQIKIGSMFHKETVFVLLSEESECIKSLLSLNLRTITCGASRRDTITFSSKNDEEIVVSLQRPITNLIGEIIEPLEIPMKKNAIDEDFTLMAYASILIETGKFDKNLHS